MIYRDTLHEIEYILVECERLLGHPDEIMGERARLYLSRCKTKLAKIVNEKQEEIMEEAINRRNWPRNRHRWLNKINDTRIMEADT
jgi:hypothetical protein